MCSVGVELTPCGEAGGVDVGPFANETRVDAGSEEPGGRRDGEDQKRDDERSSSVLGSHSEMIALSA